MRNCSCFRMTTYFSQPETKKRADDDPAEYELAAPSVRLENG